MQKQPGIKRYSVKFCTRIDCYRAHGLQTYLNKKIIRTKKSNHLSKKFVLFASLKALYKMIKNAFHVILKALFVLKIFRFLSWLFDHVEKTACQNSWRHNLVNK